MKKNKTESHYREFVCFPFNIVNSRFLLFYSLWQELYFKESSFPQLFYPLMTRQFFCDFHEKSEDFCVS